jgi:hypothetical protein
MDDEFGPGYSRSVARDQTLPSLDGHTVDTALAAGVQPREVWRAVCEAMSVPPERHWGIDRSAKSVPDRTARSEGRSR